MVFEIRVQVVGFRVSSRVRHTAFCLVAGVLLEELNKISHPSRVTVFLGGLVRGMNPRPSPPGELSF